MANFRNAVVKKVQQVACWIADNGDRQDDIWGEAAKTNPFSPIGQGSSLFSPYPLSRLLCGDADTDPPPQFEPEAPPFQGGQCETDYLVDGEGTYVVTSRGTTEIARFSGIILRGPISNPKVVQDGAIVRMFIDGFDRATRQPVTRQLFAVSGSEDGTITEITADRRDNQPDDCGNLGDGEPPVIPDEICYDRPDGSTTCDPVKITPRTPKTGPGGNIKLPFDFNFGVDVGPIKVEIDLGNGDVNIGVETPTAPDSPCCPAIAPGSPEPPETPDDPPEPEDERRFVGLIVTATTIPDGVRATEVDGGNGLSLYIPRISTISIAVEIGGSRAWTDDFAVRKRKQYFPVPASSVGYTWAVFNESGIETEITPVYIDNDTDNEE